MTYSLLRPPEGITGFLRLILPLVFVQRVALKAWMRKHYGPGVPYWYTVSHWGKVFIRHMPPDFAETGYAAPGALKPLAFDFALSARLALALTPEPPAPVSAPMRGSTMPSVHVLFDVESADTS